MRAPDLGRAVAAACPRFVNAEATQIICLSRAPASGSYRVRLDSGHTVIAKLYVGAAKWKAAKEQQIIESLSATRMIRTARILGHGQLETYDASVLITSDLGDYTLWHAIEEGRLSYHGGLGLVGHLLADFHDAVTAITAAGDVAYPSPDVILERVVQRQLSVLHDDPADRLAPQVEPALNTLVRLCRRPSTLVGCHGDLHPANVVMSRVKSGTLAAHVVDFESAVRCLPEYDLAKSIATSSALGNGERTALLAGYATRHALSEELLYAFVVFHVVDGWVQAALTERRDQSLWRSRIDTVLARYAPLF